MGKFNPAGADRDAFSKLFTDVDELNTDVGAIKQEVTEARGGYPSLNARLDDMGGGGGGTGDYSDLTNKPRINGVELSGNKTPEDLNLARKSTTDGNIAALKIQEDFLYCQSDKNIFRPVMESKTVSGVAFTVNDDGTVTVNGTAASAITLVLGAAYVEGYDLMTIAGCPNNVEGVSLSVVSATGTTLATDSGASAEFSVSGASFVKVILSIANGAEITNKKFYPMICMADKWGTGKTYAQQRLGVPALSDLIEEMTYDRAGRNLLDLRSAESQTINGITFTVNDDCSITIRGTASSSAFFSVPVVLPAGNKVFFGMTEEGGADSYRLELIATTQGNVYQISASVIPTVFTRSEEWTGYFNIRVANGYTFDNPVTVYPMIMLKGDYAKCSKYAPSIGSLRDAVVDLIDKGAKNIVQNNVESNTKYGVTATSNADGTITLSGRSTSANDFILVNDLYNPSASTSFTSNIPAKKGKQYICPATGNTGVRLQCIEYNSAIDYSVASSSDNNKVFSMTKNNMVFRIFIKSTADFTDPVTIKPMVCLKSEWDASHAYVPYRPSMDEMWEAIKALQQGGA